MKVAYKQSFLRYFKKLPTDLQQEVKEKIEVFKKNTHDPKLRAHKLKGDLSGYSAFSVNYKFRIVFVYISKTEVAFVGIGTHDIYK